MIELFDFPLVFFTLCQGQDARVKSATESVKVCVSVCVCVSAGEKENEWQKHERRGKRGREADDEKHVKIVRESRVINHA